MKSNRSKALLKFLSSRPKARTDRRLKAVYDTLQAYAAGGLTFADALADLQTAFHGLKR